MKKLMNDILKGLIVTYDAANEEQDKANALVLIQTATVNLINMNQIELGNLAIQESKLNLAALKKEASK